MRKGEIYTKSTEDLMKEYFDTKIQLMQKRMDRLKKPTIDQNVKVFRLPGKIPSGHIDVIIADFMRDPSKPILMQYTGKNNVTETYYELYFNKKMLRDIFPAIPSDTACIIHIVRTDAWIPVTEKDICTYGEIENECDKEKASVGDMEWELKDRANTLCIPLREPEFSEGLLRFNKIIHIDNPRRMRYECGISIAYYRLENDKAYRCCLAYMEFNADEDRLIETYVIDNSPTHKALKGRR